MTFVPASSIQGSDSLVVAIHGAPKTGKTSFLLGSVSRNLASWPLPIYLFNFDEGVRQLRADVAPAVWNNLFIATHAAAKGKMSEAEAVQLLAKIDVDVSTAVNAIRSAGTGTLAMDTGTIYWQLIQQALVIPKQETKVREGKTTTQLDYRWGNMHFSNSVRALLGTGVNIVLLHESEEVRDERGAATGAYVPAYHKRTPYMVDVEIQMRKGMRQVETGKDAQGRMRREQQAVYDSIIQKVRWAGKSELEGLAFEGMDYPMLYELIFEKSPPSQAAPKALEAV